MKLRLWGCALLCGASAAALADAEHERIVGERAAAHARFAEQQRDCETRFIVAPCLEDARKEHRAVLAQLRQQELKLDEAQRRSVAEARRKAIAEKAEAQQARASDAAAEAPRVRMRREPPAPAPAKHQAEGAPAHRAPDRSLPVQKNEAQFASRAREAAAHREAVARRNAERAAKGKVAAPLPVPSGAATTR